MRCPSAFSLVLSAIEDVWIAMCSIHYRLDGTKVCQKLEGIQTTTCLYRHTDVAFRSEVCRSHNLYAEIVLYLPDDLDSVVELKVGVLHVLKAD